MKLRHKILCWLGFHSWLDIERFECDACIHQHPSGIWVCECGFCGTRMRMPYYCDRGCIPTIYSKKNKAAYAASRRLVERVAPLILILCLASCDQPPLTSNAPARPADVSPKVDEVRSATAKAGTTVEQESVKIGEATQGVRADFQALTLRIPELPKQPEALRIPAKLDDIDKANAIIAEQARALQALNTAFDGIRAGTESWRVYGETMGQREAAADRRAKGADARAEAAEKREAEAKAKESKLFRVLLYTVAGLLLAGCIGLAVAAVLSGKAWTFGVISAACFVGMCIVLAIAKYLEIFIIGGAILLLVGLGMGAYQLWINRKAVRELVETVEVGVKDKLDAAGRLAILKRIDAKGIQSATTKKIVDKVQNSGSVILATPLDAE